MNHPHYLCSIHKKLNVYVGIVDIIPACSDANATESTTKWYCCTKSYFIQDSTSTLPKDRIRYSNIFLNPWTQIEFEIWRNLILERMIRQNRNSHLFYSDVTATEQRLKTGDENERESKLRLVKMSKSCWNWMRLLRYSRLIDEINEDQLDDQMDDEGSGSDSENSEVQGSTDHLYGEPMPKLAP